MHIAIAVAALFPKCQTSSCENISLESKRIYFSDLCSLSIFIPVISPIDCSFWFLQCFVQFLLQLEQNIYFKDDIVMVIEIDSPSVALSLY